MWDDPVALDRTALLLLAATLLFAAWMAGRQATEVWLPIRSIEVYGAGHAETRAGLRPTVQRLAGGWLSLDLHDARRRFEALPWVRTAMLRRVWPDRLLVHLEEHVPVAAWNGHAVLDRHGEVFAVRPWPGLPRFSAPEGMGREVANRYAQFAAALGLRGRRIAALRVDARFAWQLVLDDGVSVELGRELLDERLRRFVTFYPLAAERLAGIRRVDMRYPNGFAVRSEAAREGTT